MTINNIRLINTNTIQCLFGSIEISDARGHHETFSVGVLCLGDQTKSKGLFNFRV